MSLRPGDRLGPFEITGELGAGGMGQVYKATDTRLDRTVAIKVLLDSFAGDAGRGERFEREARAISRLNHAHICTLHDVGEADGTRYLVMEYVEGETLADRLTRGPLPLREALPFGAQIAEALSRAHRQGIVHRDLKPGNVMLTKAGVKLLDFGLAKVVGEGAGSRHIPAGSMLMPTRTQSEALTTEGSILGTLQYMSPEQLEGRDADERSDVFALGTVIYEMVTGRKAFEGRSQASLIGAIMEHEPAPMRDAQALTPPSLERLVRRALAKDPDDRWQSAADLADELRWIAGSADASPAATADDGSVRIRGRQRMLPVAAGLAVAAMAIVTGVTLTSRPRDEAPTMRFDIVTPQGASLESLAMSPDGRTMALVAPFENVPRVWLLSLETGVAEPLERTADASYPFWSPDSRSLGFFADQALQRIDLAGGVITRLADAAVGYGGTWNEDGVIVFAPTASGALFRVPATGGRTEQITQLDGRTTGHRLPQFLPGGRHILHRVGEEGGTPEALAVSDLDTGETRRVLPDTGLAAFHPPTGQLVFTRQTALMAQSFDLDRFEVTGTAVPLLERTSVTAVSASMVGPLVYRALREDAAATRERTVTWVDRTGAEVARLGTIVTRLNELDIALSPDGQTLAFGNGADGPGFLDVESGIVTPADPRTQFFVWPRDGRSYFYGSSRAGTYDLYEQRVDGSDPTLLYGSELNELPLDVSSDGRFLLFRPLNPATSGYSIWALPLDGSGAAFPVVDSKDSVNRDAEFSPDGRWIAFHSDRTGRFEIFVQPFPGPGPARQVSTSGGTQVRWRGDGRELFYLAPDDRMMAVPITLPGDGQPLRAGTPVELFRTSMAPATRWQRQQYEVSADGERFLMPLAHNRVEDMVVPITVLLNLKRPDW